MEYRIGQIIRFKWAYQENHSVELEGTVTDILTNNGGSIIVAVVDLEGLTHNFHVHPDYIL